MQGIAPRGWEEGKYLSARQSEGRNPYTKITYGDYSHVSSSLPHELEFTVLLIGRSNGEAEVGLVEVSLPTFGIEVSRKAWNTDGSPLLPRRS